jgi:hypothetical protein
MSCVVAWIAASRRTKTRSSQISPRQVVTSAVFALPTTSAQSRLAVHPAWNSSKTSARNASPFDVVSIRQSGPSGTPTSG